MLNKLTTTLCLFLYAIHVLAIPLAKRDVYSPPVTSPSSESVWRVGQTVNVTWDITNLPPDDKLSRPDGTLYLGFTTPGSSSLNLMIDAPLAKGFLLRSGSTQIKVPAVRTRSSYIVVLLGSSDNASQEFTIQGNTATGSTSSRRSSSLTVLPSTTITDPIPITGTTITGGLSTSLTASSTIASSTITPDSSASEVTSTSPSTETSGALDGTSAPASQPTNGAFSMLHTSMPLTFGLVTLICLFNF